MPNSAYGISGLFFPSEITERRGGHVQTHRSLKTECPGSIFGGRQFFILISSIIYIFPLFYDIVNFWEFPCQQLALSLTNSS